MSTAEILFNVLMFLLAYLIVFIVTYFMNRAKLKSKKKKREIGEIHYLVKKFNLDESKLKVSKMILWISVLDAFIISFVGTFIIILPMSFIWQIMIGFVLLFGLIYAVYEIYGRHLIKKGYQKKGKD